MCGIWGLLSSVPLNDFAKYYNAFMKIKNRGPEYSRFDFIDKKSLIGFHRLAIMDISAEGNQPFHFVRKDGSCFYCICNGEIYNYKYLIETFNLEVKSHSDCEVVLHLYNKFGIDKMIKLLDGEFAFIIFDFDINKNVKIFAGRDPIGVRPIFYGINDTSICISSEAKGLTDLYTKIFVFPPGKYMIYQNFNFEFITFYDYKYKQMEPTPSKEEIYNQIRERFTNAVKKRLVTEREFGCLLSGGLDSSSIVAVAAKEIKTPINVFTISFPGGTDLPFAKKVAEYVGAKHHIIEITPEQALKAIDSTIYAIESYDITTVRASVMQYLLSKYISENTNIKVLMVGEVSDELLQGYRYFHKCPTVLESYNESKRLVKDVHMFDGLRTDRTSAFHGLEVRLPFADVDFVNFIYSLPPELLIPKNNLEKNIFREAFLGLNYLPDDIILRKKEALSDAVSSHEKSWYQMIQDYINNLITDQEFSENKDNFKHCPPITKESYYYRKKFCEYFGDTSSTIIPYFWLPKWSGNVTDPSARTLNYYEL